MATPPKAHLPQALHSNRRSASSQPDFGAASEATTVRSRVSQPGGVGVLQARSQTLGDYLASTSVRVDRFRVSDEPFSEFPARGHNVAHCGGRDVRSCIRWFDSDEQLVVDSSVRWSPVRKPDSPSMRRTDVRPIFSRRAISASLLQLGRAAVDDSADHTQRQPEQRCRGQGSDHELTY